MQCEAKVYKRDTYRRTGRGKTGFEMHYTLEQCKRQGKPKYCWQHRKLDELHNKA